MPSRKPQGWGDWNPVGDYLNKKSKSKPIKSSLRATAKTGKTIRTVSSGVGKSIYGDPKKGPGDVITTLALNFGGGVVGKGAKALSAAAKAEKFGKTATNVASAAKSARDIKKAKDAAKAAKIAAAKKTDKKVVRVVKSTGRGAKKVTKGTTKVGASVVGYSVAGSYADRAGRAIDRRVKRK